MYEKKVDWVFMNEDINIILLATENSIEQNTRLKLPQQQKQ